MGKITVIIPAYNAGSYIKHCLESIVNQPGFQKYVKIILVIDGATDNTQLIARETLQSIDCNYEILTQENLGASAARNHGLTRTETEYVTFLDADDMWLPNYLATIIPQLSNSLDIIEYDAALVDQNGHYKSKLKIASAATGLIHSIKPDDFLKIFRCYSWARIYRTSLVKAHPFPEGRRFEDCATTPWYYWVSKHILSIGQELIAYRQHPGSVLATPAPNDIDEITIAVHEAAMMYEQTTSSYWQSASYKILHFAYQRATRLPPKIWQEKLQYLLATISKVPRPVGATRWIQIKTPMLYTALLFIKHRTMDARK